jgi:hypothetical protein
MINRSLPLKAALLLALFLCPYFVPVLNAQCTNCASTLNVPQSPVRLQIPAGTNSAQPASSGLGLFNATISNSPSGSPVPNGPYAVWCADFQTAAVNANSDYVPYSTYGTLPPAVQGAPWPKINWILNNKQGTVGDVQRAIWIVLTGTSTLPQTPESDAMIAGANANPAFVPGPGQVMAVFLYADGFSTNLLTRQDLILVVPVPDCGAIGDFVWRDNDYDGLQDAGEPGINGVTVRLLQGSNVIATTVTGPVPAGYPDLPPGSNGYYQFTGLCQNTYTVSVDVNQPALSGFIASPANVGGGSNASTDSNSNPYTVTLPTNTTIDRTIDFGFYNPVAISLACQTTTGVVGVPYNGALVVTGGLQPFTYSISSGSLPADLALNTTSGAITGIPQTAGTFSFTGKVVDVTGLASGTATANCSVTINERPSANCVQINAVQGVPIAPVTLIGQGGAGGPYTFTATGLPAGLMLSTQGVISGTPAESGTFSYLVTIKDKDGNTGTLNCSVTVLTRPSATCVQINAVQGVAITPVTLAGTGGAGGPYTFTATGLPAGLTLSAQGELSGTPAVTGTFSYIVTIRDKNGNTGTLNCSVTVTPPPSCPPATFEFTGNTSTYGQAGNIRTFTAGGVQVKVSAFSRAKDDGSWSTAYLGSYPGGLGVTDGSEGNGGNNTHKVDNIGTRVNYVLFEFSSPVVVNRALLDVIGKDSDLSVWIGTKTDPFNNHLTLNDSVLSSLGFTEENLTSSSVTSRWADINAGNVQGNVVVIAALASDDSPEDEFKLEKLDVSCPQTPPSCTGSVGDFVWKDINGNGIQDAGEPGISGVTLQLKNGATVIATTTTNTTGYYQFTGVCPGSYTVVVATPPSGYTASPSLAGTNRAVDSNGSPAAVTLTASSPSDQTIDFGYVPATLSCPPAKFDFTGNTSTYGHAGNIRTFTAGGVQVNVSAFSRAKDNGSWSTAYLGSYPGGLGVTDGSEGNGGNNTHKVDNIGARVNYVLFEFSSPVVVDRALLDVIGKDSDLSVWIGTKADPFNNHLTLNDSVLSSLGFTEENLTSSSVTSRWADINAGNIQGNVVVIAALANDDSPEDEFKLEKLEVSSCPPPPSGCTASIGNFVWADDGDGIQETGEAGIAGVTVKLYNATTNALIASTTTAANGLYLFSNLCAGTYKVVVIAPDGRESTTANASGSTDANDSNPNPATVTLLAGEADLTIDFGFRKTSGSGGCTYTLGYWKNHEDDWPVTSLVLGSKTYSKAELLALLGMPVQGDSSISLAHQLIAAKLNAANGAQVPTIVEGLIDASDKALSMFSGKLPYDVKSITLTWLASSLEKYNAGELGAKHCQ